MNRVSRSEKILDELQQRGALTEEGKEWLIAALDPFHDTPVKPRGWPDLETAASVVRCIKQSVTLKKPDSVTTAGWDCFIIAWPWRNANVTQAATGANNIFSSSAPIGPIGGVQAFGAAVGSSLDFATTPSMASLKLDPYTVGTNRLIASGLEVVNTTADIYKQGLATSWRMNATRRAASTCIMANGDTRVFTPLSVQFYEQPPATIAQAMLIPGTKQWKAEDGCYAVVGFVGQDNPPECPNYVQPAVVVFAPDPEEEVVQTTFMPVALGSDGLNNLEWVAQRLFPTHVSGVYLTGLSDQTTLVLNTVDYVETFPTPTEEDILVLATPSAQYDPVALELYSHCMRKLPPACMVGENPLGEWFAEAVSEAADFLAPIAAAVGAGPIAGIAKGAGAMARYYLKSVRPPTAKSKPVASLPPPLPKRLPPPANAPALTKAQKKRARRRAKAKGVQPA